MVEGQTLSEEKILIICRNGQTNKKLNNFFETIDNSEFNTIYVNGDNNLENLKKESYNFKVKLIEQEFKALMFGE